MRDALWCVVQTCFLTMYIFVFQSNPSKMGGNIRGGTEYDKGSFFSLEALEAEIKSDEVIGVVTMPGWLLAEGVSQTHSGDPIPGWIQYDDGVKEEYPEDGSPPIVTHVNGKPIEHDLTYRVATKISDLTNGQSPAWTECM